MSMKDPKSTPETARSEADTPPGAQSPPFDGTLRLLTRFERFAWDIGGVIALAFTLMTLLALVLPQLTRGVLLSWWAGKLQLWFGWGSIWVIVTTGVLGLWMLRQRHTIDVPQVRWGRVLALELAAFASLALLSVLGGTSLKNAEAGLDGGVIGWGLAELLRLILQPIGLSAAFWRALLVGAIFVISSITGLGLVAPLAAWAGKSELEPELSGADAVGANPVVSEAPLPGQEAAASVEKSSRKKRLPLPAQFRKNFRLQPEDAEKPILRYAMIVCHLWIF